MEADDLLLAGKDSTDLAEGRALFLPQYCQSLTPTARAGDDSSWNMSDWQWDSNAFVAVPKLEQQSGCCKRRKTSIPAAKRHSRPCGSCKATDGPLKFLQQAGDSAGSNSCGEGSDGQRNAVVRLYFHTALSPSDGIIM